MLNILSQNDTYSSSIVFCFYLTLFVTMELKYIFVVIFGKYFCKKWNIYIFGIQNILQDRVELLTSSSLKMELMVLVDES